MSRSSWRRAGRLFAALAAVTAMLPSIADDGVLVRHDFEGDVATGPYTFTVFEHSSGSVALSELFRHSGSRSVEIRDVAGDGEFAELQGFFPHVKSGIATMRFALLVAEPRERLNVAFAGPSHFSMEADGIGFWLKARGGRFLHVTDRDESVIATIESFVWYEFEVLYDVGEGRYDLTVWREGEASPLVRLENVRNATGIAGSGLDRFSFIGDVPWEDGSNARFYVDDLLIATDSAAQQGPFVAPGRRMLFVDIWDHFQRELYRQPECPPYAGLADFGVDAVDRRRLQSAGLLTRLIELIDGCEPGVAATQEEVDEDLRRRLDAAALWRQGCAAPPGCATPCAVELFVSASELVPEGKIYEMSAVLALASAARWDEADELFASIHPRWQDDPRYPAIAATLGLARGDLEAAEEQLAAAYDVEPVAGERPILRRLWSGELGRLLVDELKAEFPDDWNVLLEAALVLEQRYHVLLWQERYGEARSYAERWVVRSRKLGVETSRWMERAGDAAFYEGDHHAALEHYESMLDSRARRTAALLKLSDVHFMLGHHELERAYREK
ncbi:MAG: hypothetical protein OEQ13_11885, partial [Acidobacteriota bacterium]|nr:hypothetical protein [Acidobacteriota bacterium]